MNLTLDKVAISEQSKPSTQLEKLLADPDGRVWRINNTAGVFKSICLEMSAPVTAATNFQDGTLPLPPAGFKYYFCDSDTSGSPLSTVDSDGTVVQVQTPLSYITQATDIINFSRPLRMADYTGETSVQFANGAVQMRWVAADKMLRLQGSPITGTNPSLRLDFELLGLFGVTPVEQPTALTTKNTSAFSSGGTEAMTDADVVILNNMRTRINELETKLTALGALSV